MSDQNPDEGVSVQVRLMPEPSLPYVKADIFQACRLSGSYAVTCFQFDYQMVAAWGTSEPRPAEQPEARTVTKIVMDEEGFRRLREEVNRIASITGIQ